MADKYTKVKPKVHPLTITAIVGFFVLIIALIIVLQPSNKDRIYNAYDPYASNDFTEEHPFYEVQYKSSLFKKGLKKIIENEELVFVFIGYPGCSSCQAHIGSIQKYYEQLELNAHVDMIYYFDPQKDADSEGNSEQFEAFRNDFEDVKTTTPQLIVFKDGEILKQFEVASGDDSQLINRSVRKFFEEVIDLVKE